MERDRYDCFAVPAMKQRTGGGDGEWKKRLCPSDVETRLCKIMFFWLEERERGCCKR